MEWDSLDKRCFLLVAFLLGLPLLPSKLHTFVQGEILLNVWLDVWFYVTWSLLSIKIGVWHSRLWGGCVSGIELKYSFKFTTWGCGKWELWSMPPTTLVIFCVFLKLLWNFSYHDQKERWCRNPTLRECEDETHTPKIGTWESSGTPESFGTPKISEFDCKGQNTLH